MIMIGTIIIFGLGLFVLIPFSKSVRRLFGMGLMILSVYLLGWIVFLSMFGALYCWCDPTCAYLN